jgi:hypothetical protein
MSEAVSAFERSIKDADELLARFDKENKSSSEYNPETLKRAGLVMAMAAWDYIFAQRIRDSNV